MATLIFYINQSQIDVARWTLDSRELQLNVIGRGFQNFEMDFSGYEQEFKCYNFKDQYQAYTYQRSVATNDIQKYLLDEQYRSIHKNLCGGTKSYTSFPSYPKTSPSIAGYGSIKPNLSSLEGYDVVRGEYELYSNSDIAYLSLNYIGERVNQDLTSFTLKTKKGVVHTYNLPAPNYMYFSPREGTVGTEITASFKNPTNPANYTLNLSMDKIPLLNQVFKYDSKGFIIGVTFNVPYISKGSRIICERLPINGKGEKFIFYSTESLQFKPYKELKGLSYAKSTVDYIVEVEAPFHYPILESGKATYYKILSGKIPPGLVFSRTHAVIYGRPKLAQPPTELVIEANDGYKKVQTTLTVSASMPTVVPAPTLNYSASGYSMLVGKKFIISPVGPKGTNVKYNIDRGLPAGINFDMETGTISGYPTSIMSEMKFNITASNPTGFAKFSLGLQIIADKASYILPTISFSSVNYSLTRNQSILIPPTIFGSGPYEFSATGLPQGMSIDSQTGILSGTPAILQEPADVLITIQNYAGVASSKLLMSVTDTPSSAPTNLTFTNTTYDFTNGMAISTISPTVTGLLTNCNSSPALPTGLTLNSACQISGTPTTDVTNVVYTITGTNASGGTVATITLTVGSFPPSNLVFTGTPYSLNQNASTVITPTYSGGIASCASAPALPTGLIINNSTCAIGGTPTAITGSTNYTITATNAFGSTNAVINITVATVAPSALTYVGSPYSFFQSTASSSGTPTINGSPVTSCTSAPALPAGLTISNTTCTISGSPSGLQGSTSYTITATNAAGNTQATIQIAVALQPPNNLLYVGDPFVLGKNVVSSITPSLTGTPTTCTSSPALPAGLSISNTTCAITGTATTLQSATSYTITASNASGSNNAVISIKIVNFWKHESYLRMPYVVANTEFGSSVGISSDTIVVGATYEESNQTTIINGTTGPSISGGSEMGAAVIYKRTGVNWAQEAYIVASNRNSFDKFGSAVAIDGDTVAIGAYYEGSNQTTITNGTTSSADNSAVQRGAVYVYKRTGSTWVQEAYIKPSSNTTPLNQYGVNVALSGETLAVLLHDFSNQTTIINGTTAPSGNSGGHSDAVLIYKRTGVNWAQEAYIRTTNPTYGTADPRSISLDGDTLALGRYNDGSNQTTITNGTTTSPDTSFTNSGAVYVFKRTGVNWVQEAYIKPSVNYAWIKFGTSVSVSGDSLAVSSLALSAQTTISSTESSDLSGTIPGAVYIYKRTGSNWAREAYIKSPVTLSFGSRTFGDSISLSGDSLLVGSADNSGVTTVINSQPIPPDSSYGNSGAVYSFQRNGTTWEWESFLKLPYQQTNQPFGAALFLSGNTVIVANTRESSCDTGVQNGTTVVRSGSCSESGAAHVFKKQ